MFHSSWPNRLYQEYQSRADAAVLRRSRKSESQPIARRSRAPWQKGSAWFAILRMQVARRIQPEEGYIA